MQRGSVGRALGNRGRVLDAVVVVQTVVAHRDVGAGHEFEPRAVVEVLRGQDQVEAVVHAAGRGAAGAAGVTRLAGRLGPRVLDRGVVLPVLALQAQRIVELADVARLVLEELGQARLGAGVEVEVAHHEAVRARGHGVHAVAQPRRLGEALGLEAGRGLQVHRVDAHLGGLGGVADRLDPPHVHPAQQVRGVRVEDPLAQELHLRGLEIQLRVAVVAVLERRGVPLTGLHHVEVGEELARAGRRHLLGHEHVRPQGREDHAVERIAYGAGRARVVEDVVVDDAQRVGRRGAENEQREDRREAGSAARWLGGHSGLLGEGAGYGRRAGARVAPGGAPEPGCIQLGDGTPGQL